MNPTSTQILVSSKVCLQAVLIFLLRFRLNQQFSMLTGMIGEELSHDSELGMQSVSLCEDSVSMNDNDPSNNVTLAAPPSNEQGVCGHIQFCEVASNKFIR